MDIGVALEHKVSVFYPHITTSTEDICYLKTMGISPLEGSVPRLLSTVEVNCRIQAILPIFLIGQL